MMRALGDLATLHDNREHDEHTEQCAALPHDKY
jgi:hypothetical protein